MANNHIVDRNSQTPQRTRRNWQRARSGALTGSITLSATGGLKYTSNALSIKLADTSLTTTAPGLAVNLKTNAGLQTSSGVGILLNGTSLSLGASGIAVALRTNPGLQISAGLGILVNGSSLTLGASGISVVLQSSGGLQISSGVGILLNGATSLSGLNLSASGLKIQLAGPSGLGLTASGLTVSIDSTGFGLSIGSGGLKYTSPITTKGDLIVGNNSGVPVTPTRLPIGANDTILTADSAQTLGMKWSATANLTAYQVGGTQVVGAQGAAVADATGAGDVVAQLNALLARVRTHGLIAP